MYYPPLELVATRELPDHSPSSATRTQSARTRRQDDGAHTRTGVAAPTSIMTASVAKPVADPTWLCAAPLHDFVQKLESEMTTLSHRFPESGHASVLRSIKDELVRVISSAAQVAVYVNIERLHALTAIPISTLRRQCSNHQSRVGASKRHGQWYIHWPTYHKVMTQGRPICIDA
jgi:hypothetical protein